MTRQRVPLYDLVCMMCGRTCEPLHIVWRASTACCDVCGGALIREPSGETRVPLEEIEIDIILPRRGRPPGQKRIAS